MYEKIRRSMYCTNMENEVYETVSSCAYLRQDRGQPKHQSHVKLLPTQVKLEFTEIYIIGSLSKTNAVTS